MAEFLSGERIQASSEADPRANTGVAVSDQLHRYDFEETSGTTLDDKVGSIDGTASGGIDQTNVGVFGSGNAWKFDGTDGKVEIEQTFGTVSAISCSVWIKRFGTGRCSIAVDSSTSNFGTGLWFEDRDGSTYGLRIGHQVSGDDVNTQTRIPADDEYHHVVFSAYASGAEIYLDGVQLGDVSTTGHSSGAYGSALNLAYNDSANVYGNCQISEMIFFNKRLTQSEITELYTRLTTNEMDNITNVPTGTRLEDTATRKIYRRNDPIWIERGVASPSLKVWYDADDSSTITESSDKVSQWNDKSGQGNHISQSSANQQPTVTANIQNGKPVIRFSESSDDEYMQRATWTGGAITQPFSVFFVGTYESTSEDGFRFVYDSGGSSDRYWASQDRVSSERRYNVASATELKSASGVVPPQTIQQYTMTYNGSSSSARKNGTDMVTGNAGTNSGNGMTIARRYSAGGSDTSTNMDMCELLIYEGALDDSVRDSIESYLQTKWGL